MWKDVCSVRIREQRKVLERGIRRQFGESDERKKRGSVTNGFKYESKRNWTSVLGR